LCGPPLGPDVAKTPAKIIDGHVHIVPWHLALPHIAETLKRTQPNFPELQKLIDSPDAFVKKLDDEGIEKAALINYVAPEVMGFPKSINEWIWKYTKDHRDRLIPVGGIHPFHVDQPKKEVETLLSKYELGAIKLHPVHSLFHPNDYEIGGGALRILYDQCERAGVPIIVHTGTSIFPKARNKFGDPMDLDDVAVDYPKLKIAIAHVGRPLWTESAQFLARRHKNVFLDLSGIPPSKLLEYVPQLERLADRSYFGSDWPGPMIPSMRQNADEVAALALPEAAKRAILYDNALKFFRT
jgi:uncharacterized protein